MAPVVQVPVANNTNGKPNEKARKLTERRPELFCRVKYCNTLPDIPFDPKFITYPFDNNRFVQYKQTSLEKNYKHDLLTEQDLGVAIDLINPETYEITDPTLRIHEEDERLLEDEIAAPQDTKRSQCHNRAVTWLKKTEYISTEFNRYGASSDKTETKVGFGVKKKLEENLYLDRESQILAINKTFESAKKPILAHPGKPGVKPVEILPVFPDFDGWKYPFAQVIFDADPAANDREEEMSQAMIRGVMDESGQQFVAYFLPTEETLQKRKIDQLEDRDYVEEQEYEYTMAREYNWNVKNKATKGYEENYFFVWKNDVVCYDELETRVKLSKRRGKNSQPTNSRLVVKHRPMQEQEYKVQDIRITQLEPPQDDEEGPSAATQSNQEEEDEENNLLNDGDDDDDNEEEEEENDDDDNMRMQVDDEERRERVASSDDDDENDDDEEANDNDNDRHHGHRKISASTKQTAKNNDDDNSDDDDDDDNSEKSSDSESSNSEVDQQQQQQRRRRSPIESPPKRSSSSKKTNGKSNNKNKKNVASDDDDDDDSEKSSSSSSEEEEEEEEGSSDSASNDEDDRDGKKSSPPSSDNDDEDSDEEENQKKRRRQEEAARIFGSDSDD